MTAKRKMKFKARQVVYDLLQREYFKCDADLALEINSGKSTAKAEGVRPLTKREAGNG